ncbi:MAG: HEAT repeat domain-containing protein [Anaerolineales bacterium]|nr:HEAT repeat domain-containing protein [Anaerolineales bacterium]
MVDPITKALQALSSADPRERRDAALLLAEHPSVTVAEALVNALGDPQLSVQEAIMQALMRQPQPETIRLLVRVLQESNTVRRNAALSVLLEIGYTQPEEVIRSLRHPSAEVRQWAAEMLGELPLAIGSEALRERLEDATEFPTVRRAAAQSLGKLSDQTALPALLEAAAHGDFWLRQAAIEALSCIGDERAVPPLLELMRRDAWMRPAVIKTLGNIGHVDAVPELVAALDDPNDSIRNASLEALFRIVMEPAGRRTDIPHAALLRPVIPVAPLQRELAARRMPNSSYAAHLLGWLAQPEALPDLVEALNSPEASLRDAATEALLRFGQAAVPVLVQALQRPETAIRERSVDLLGMIGDNSIVPSLTRLLADPQLTVRHAALRALGMLGGEAAYAGLLAAVSDPTTREAALSIFEQINDESVINDLKSYLQRFLYAGHSESMTRWAAAQALSLLGDEVAVSILLNATRLPDDSIRIPAAEALGRVRGRRGVNVLIEALGDRDWLVRQKAVEALGNIPDSRVIAALIPMTRDPEWRVRWALVGALSHLRDSRLYASLRELSQDSDLWVRRRVMEVCGRLDDARAVEIALLGLKDADPRVRSAALVALRPYRDPALLPALAELVHDPEPEVRYSAARTIGMVLGNAAIDLLQVLAHDPVERVRRRVASVLAELGTDEGLPVLEMLLRDNAPVVRRYAGEALVHIGTPAAASVLAEALTHPTARPEAEARLLALGEAGLRATLSAARSTKAELRLAAAQLLSRFRYNGALPTLQFLTRDSDQRVRAAAEAALKELAG